MQSRRPLVLLVTAFTAVFGFLTIAAPLLAANKEKVLHSFNAKGRDGANPQAGLIFDAAGNLYGTTSSSGGTGCYGAGCGTVFQLAPSANGKWTAKVLHSFSGNDGSYPRASLIFDAAGNLYGTTEYGGAANCGGGGCGTVFRLTHEANGKWTETVLYSFCSAYVCSDGVYPVAGLIFDASGNLYGTTSSSGGTYTGGTVFQLTPGTNGQWTEKVLHRFNNPYDGPGPESSLILDAAGNLYGMTAGGGTYYNGAVFQLSPGTNGKWTEKVLHSFGKGTDGSNPSAGLIFDSAGNLYGTTRNGGTYQSGCYGAGCGTAFELSLGSNGKWTEKVLHSFGKGTDGIYPCGGLIFDAAGNLYGTTATGGAHISCSGEGCGTVFELVPGNNGKWTEKVLHSFNDNSQDGNQPVSSLIFDGDGNLYGTTAYGGTFSSTNCGGRGCGTVFEIAP